jgi:hypothetical protein
VWSELLAAGRITYHPVFPGRAGLAARRIRDELDVEDVIRLLRLNYERLVLAQTRDAAGEDGAGFEQTAA